MALSGEQEFTTEVAASVAQCFATITDFDKYPQWFSAIEHTQVLSRWPDGLAKRVEYRIDMKLKSIRYVLQYAYDKPTRLDWKSVDGDIEAIAGSYVFEKLATKRSRVTCRQAVSFGFWVPGPLRAIMERQALKQAVLEFKDAAEHAAKESAGSRRKKT
jgi:ribosome-associated toxin RatA of RatAB toxin-antitoxin module